MPMQSVFAFSDFRALSAAAAERTKPDPKPPKPAPTVTALRCEWVDGTGRRVAVLPSFSAAEAAPVGVVARIDTKDGAAWFQRASEGWITCDPAVLEPCDRSWKSALAELCEMPNHSDPRYFQGMPEYCAYRVATAIINKYAIPTSEWHDRASALVPLLDDETKRPMWLLRPRPGVFCVDPMAVVWSARAGSYVDRVFATLAEATGAVDPSRPTLLGETNRPVITIRIWSWDGDTSFVDLDMPTEPVPDKGTPGEPNGGFREPTPEEIDEQAKAYARAAVEAWFAARERAALDVITRRAVDPGTSAAERARIIAGLQALKLTDGLGTPHVERVTVARAG